MSPAVFGRAKHQTAGVLLPLSVLAGINTAHQGKSCIFGSHHNKKNKKQTSYFVLGWRYRTSVTSLSVLVATLVLTNLNITSRFSPFQYLKFMYEWYLVMMACLHISGQDSCYSSKPQFYLFWVSFKEMLLLDARTALTHKWESLQHRRTSTFDGGEQPDLASVFVSGSLFSTTSRQ